MDWLSAGNTETGKQTTQASKTAKITLKNGEKKSDIYLVAKLMEKGIFAASVKIVCEALVENGIEVTVEYD